MCGEAGCRGAGVARAGPLPRNRTCGSPIFLSGSILESGVSAGPARLPLWPDFLLTDNGSMGPTSARGASEGLVSEAPGRSDGQGQKGQTRDKTPALTPKPQDRAHQTHPGLTDELSGPGAEESASRCDWGREKKVDFTDILFTIR